MTLKDRLKALHDQATLNERNAVDNRVLKFNEHKRNRVLEVNNEVLLRVSDLPGALDPS